MFTDELFCVAVASHLIGLASHNITSKEFSVDFKNSQLELINRILVQ